MFFRSRLAVHQESTSPGPWRKKRHLLYRASGWLFTLLILAGVFFASGAPLAHAASPLPAKGDGISPLGNYGSGIQYHPKVYLVFWGPEWQSDPDAVIPQVKSTFEALPGSSYNNILSQYTDGTGNPDGYVHNDVQLMGTWIDPSTPPSGIDLGVETWAGVYDNAQVRNEAQKALTTNNWPTSHDTQVIVFPQKGTTYLTLSFEGVPIWASNFCGMHAYDSTFGNQFAYSVIQYGDQVNCDNVGDPAEDIAWTAVHEYAESATDRDIYGKATSWSPYISVDGTGWHTNENTVSPNEVADLCEGYNSAYAYQDYQDPVTGRAYTLPLLWSNADNGCVSSLGQDYYSTASPGRHTVQAPILNHYISLEATLGEPVSELTHLSGGGLVSYFEAGGCSNASSHPYSSCGAIYWSSATGAYADWGNDYAKYLSENGPSGSLGFPLSDPIGIASGEAYSLFQGSGPCGSSNLSMLHGACAAIFDKIGLGTYADWGNDLVKYIEMNGPSGTLGFPLSDPIGIASGEAYSLFQGGGGCGSGNLSMLHGACAAIFDTSGLGTYADWGNDLVKYVEMNGPSGTLGNLQSDPTPITYSNGEEGSVSYFTGQYCGPATATHTGSAIYSSPAGAYEIQGCIYNFYMTDVSDDNRQPIANVLGYPLSDETGITDYYGTSGRVNYFTANAACGSPGPDGSDGAIYWTGSNAYEVHGCIYGTYMQQWGGPSGVLGFPVSSEYINAAGQYESDFQGGSIIWENGTGVVTLNCLGAHKCN